MRIFAAASLFLTMTFAVAAQDKKDIFDPGIKVTWLGIDFSGVKLIGERERFGSTSDTRHLMDSWNDIFLKEKDKFDPAPSIGRKDVTMAIEVAKEHNANLELLELFSDKKEDYIHLTEGDVDRIISEYDFKGNTGLGMMFVAESFSYLNQEASIWVTFVDLGSNKVLLTERMYAPPGGAGVRNNWANASFRVLEKLKREFPKLKKKHVG